MAGIGDSGELDFRVDRGIGEEIFCTVFVHLRGLARGFGAHFELFGQSDPPRFGRRVTQPSLGLELHISGEEYHQCYRRLNNASNARRHGKQIRPHRALIHRVRMGCESVDGQYEDRYDKQEAKYDAREVKIVELRQSSDGLGIRPFVLHVLNKAWEHPEYG